MDSPMTKEGRVELEKQIKHLKQVERPAIIRAIADAREHGDLSENAEYHAAKEKQGFIEGEIAKLEGIMATANVIDVSALSGSQIKFGATVKLIDVDSEEEKTYQIVGEFEADVEKNKISIMSPLARALIGKSEGDEIEVKTPKAIHTYEVISVRYL